uniref:Uncharacterized protein n=1 Tax=Romanomermis culicivorax TaxID=13658 RepID=A0A915HJP1_ROMCU
MAKIFRHLSPNGERVHAKKQYPKAPQLQVAKCGHTCRWVDGVGKDPPKTFNYEAVVDGDFVN